MPTANNNNTAAVQQQQQPLVAGQLSNDTYLYVWTAMYLRRLNRRNKVTSPLLQIPEQVREQLNCPTLESMRLVLLRGVVKAEREEDDPIGVFLQCSFSSSPSSSSQHNGENKNKEESSSSSPPPTAAASYMNCKLSISCTPVRPGGHSHSGGPEEFIFHAKDSFKGMRALLPAAALNPKVPGGKTARSEQRGEEELQMDENAQPEDGDDDDDDNDDVKMTKDDEDEARFAETSPVEIHAKIQFVFPSLHQQQQQQQKQGESSTTSTTTTSTTSSSTIADQATSFFGGVATSASSWWSAATTVVAEKTKDINVTSSVKAALSVAAERVENVAHKIMDGRKEETADAAAAREQLSQRDEHGEEGTSTSATRGENGNNDGAQSQKQQELRTPWDDVPASYRRRSNNNNNNNARDDDDDEDDDDDGTENDGDDEDSTHRRKHQRQQQQQQLMMTPERWTQLVTVQIVTSDESTFLWAPESAYGVHCSASGSRQQSPTSSSSSPPPPSSSSSIHVYSRPQYPFFTFTPEEECALSQVGLSANLLLHCNDSYDFDTDVQPNFINPKDSNTLGLRQMRFQLVPRVVSEEKFWAAYLWRCACLALCTNVEQEAVVKTVLSKPVSPVVVVKNPHQEDGGGGGASSSSSSPHGAANNTTTSASGGDHQGEGEGEDDAGNNQQHQQQQQPLLPDSSALILDANEALSLLEEVVDEMGASTSTKSSSSSSSSPLFVASLRGTERCLRNITDAIELYNNNNNNNSNTFSSSADHHHIAAVEKLTAMKTKLEAAVAQAHDVVSSTRAKAGDAEQEQEEERQREASSSSSPTSIPSPSSADEKTPQAQTTSDKEGEEEKAASSSSPVSSPTSSQKPKTPVLMPWEEDDE